MINSQHLTSESAIIDASYFSQNNPQTKNPFCHFKNDAIYVCTNKKCKKLTFICQDKQCECRKQHQMCVKLQIQSLIKNIELKKVSIEPLENCINDAIQEIIDSLSIFRDETIIKMKEDFEFFGLSKNEKEFMKDIKNGKCENSPGRRIWQIIHSQRESDNITKLMKQTSQSLRKEFRKIKQLIQWTVQNTKTVVQQLDKKVGKFLIESEINNYLKSREKPLINLQIQFYHSKILTYSKQFEHIENFFIPKTIKEVNLLYRASDNDFSARKFHEECDGVPHTLVLVETQFGKKIGAYTSVKWRSPQSGTYVSDDTMTSFMFSLTEGDKFNLTNNQQAVCHHSSYGPRFGGGHDLCIRDKANINKSYANINHTYQNKKYEYNHKDTWLIFSGNPFSSYQFKIKQWQVWKIEFN